jgi:hypothetical protein
VEDLEYHDHTSVVIPDLLSAIRRALQAALNQPQPESSAVTAERYGQSPTEFVKRQLLVIQRRTSALRGLNDLVLRLARTTYERKPPWVGELLASIIQNHSPDATFEIIFEARPLAVEYEFEDARTEILDQHLKALSPDNELDETLIRDLPETILILGYPAAGPNNVLLHPMFFHEVGHYVTKGIVQQLQRTDDLVSEITFEDHVNSAERVNLLKQCQDIDSRWTWEVASDLFAVRLVGPAYFFGLAHVISLSCTLLEVQPEHPPALFRLQAMLDLLGGKHSGRGTDHLRYISGDLKRWMGEIQALIAEEERSIDASLQRASESTTLDYLERYQRLKQRLPQIRDAVIKLTEKDAYRADTRSRNIKAELVKQLLADIPANEHRLGDANYKKGEVTPVGVGDILNAGYEVLYNCNAELVNRYRKRQVVSGDSTPSERETDQPVLAGALRRVRRLLVKSFELKHIQDEYVRIKTQVPHSVK